MHPEDGIRPSDANFKQLAFRPIGIKPCAHGHQGTRGARLRGRDGEGREVRPQAETHGAPEARGGQAARRRRGNATIDRALLQRQRGDDFEADAMSSSSVRKTNRDIERHYFEQFRSAYGLQGVPTYRDKPDVILNSDRTIGIEITNFYVASGDDETSEQRQRPRRARVVSDAQRAHRAAGGRRTALTITVNPDKAITPTRHGHLGRELADLAHSVDADGIG